MKKELLVLLLVLCVSICGAQTRTKWKITGNVKLDSIMLSNEKYDDYNDSLRLAGYTIPKKDLYIERNVDEFTNEITINTETKLDGVTLYKYINKGIISYYLSLEVEASSVHYGIRGVTVLFTDGTKWFKPSEKVKLNYRSGFHYSSFISLSQTDIQLFSSKFIKAYRLYIYDTQVDKSEAVDFLIGVYKVRNSK